MEKGDVPSSAKKKPVFAGFFFASHSTYAVRFKKASEILSHKLSQFWRTLLTSSQGRA
jgi:hypothetical protein